VWRCLGLWLRAFNDYITRCSQRIYRGAPGAWTQLKEPAVTLGYFLDFLERQGSPVITIELALRWAMQPKLVQRATWARRLSMVRRFTAWLSTFDPRHEVPPARLLDARRRRRKPHIYTDQEIEKLMAEAARLHSPAGLRPRTYVTLIGLLAATGLRPNEALALNISDVDLKPIALS
jgi:integrase